MASPAGGGDCGEAPQALGAQRGTSSEARPHVSKFLQAQVAGVGCPAARPMLRSRSMNFVDILSPACALFLDFDGTLVDIAPEPGAVVVHCSLVPTLTSLQQYLGGAVAVVSGRPIREIDQYLAPLQLPVAGVHGAERRGAAGDVDRSPASPLEVVLEAATGLARRHPELLVEDKGTSLALHYRRAPHPPQGGLAVMGEAGGRTPRPAPLRGQMG